MSQRMHIGGPLLAGLFLTATVLGQTDKKPAGTQPTPGAKKEAKAPGLDFNELWRKLQGANVSGDPDVPKLITTDIDNFWRAYDQAKDKHALSKPATTKELAEILEREYFKPGTGGLRDFIRLRIKSADDLARTLHAYPKYYASIRESTLKVASMEKRIRASFYAMKHLYPDAVFPDVYFIIGKMGTGGTTSARGLLIGMEMYSRTPQASDAEFGDWHKRVLVAVENLPYIVAHELIHYQQKHPPTLKSTLLAQSIIEGGADFLGELISGGQINQHLHVWGNAREKQLWEEFRKDMDANNSSRWLYNGSKIKDRPADLGYYIGYKVVEAHYARAQDKKQAIREILTIQDFTKFLKDSKYETKWE